MARRQSQAVAGFYPTSPLALARAVAMLQPSGSHIRICDPCAGEGVALEAIWSHVGRRDTAIVAVEMEKSRYNALCQRIPPAWDRDLLHGDLFQTSITDRSVNLLWLNPPYDYDKDYGRLEERFLQRTIPLLVEGGTLMLVVPAYALRASARTLASHVGIDVRCYRFPESEYGVYKQVVLVGWKVQRPAPDPRVEDIVNRWDSDPDMIPELPVCPTAEDMIPIRSVRVTGFHKPRLVGIDLKAMVGFDPWYSDKGPISGLCPSDDVLANFQRKWPVATRPRAAHLAAALAAGIFNGCRVESDSPGRYPPLLVKGTFDKEWRTVDEKTNKDGEKVGEVQVQQPALSVTVLDLQSGLFHSVGRASQVNPEAPIDQMTLADLIDRYGLSLMRAMLNACPVGFDPARGDVGPPVNDYVGRPLYPAQLGVVQASLKLLDEDPKRGVVVLGEIGSGKTSVALATAAARGCKRILVMCPPHLLSGWADQASVVLPNAISMVLDNLQSVDRFFAPGDDVRIGILSREKAKLGHGWASVASKGCPKCGVPLYSENDFAAKRETCQHETRTPRNDLACWIHRNLPLLAQYFPNHAMVQALFPTTRSRLRALRKYMGQGPLPVDDRLRAMFQEKELLSDSNIARWLVWAVPAMVSQIVDVHATDVAWDVDSEWKCLALALSKPINPRWSQTQLYGSHSWAAWDRFHTWLYGEGDGNAAHDAWSWSDWRRTSEGVTYRGLKQESPATFQKLLDNIYMHARFDISVCGEPLYQATPEPRRYPLAKHIAKRYLDKYDALILDEAHELSSEGSAQTNAAQRLLQGKQAIRLLLTGSLANGYAESLFLNLHAISPKFRADFGREDRTRFIDRYGYWKRVVEEKDSKGKVVAFGSQSDRVLRTARRSGVAPGVLPVFLLEHLLPVAVTLQKEDLRIDIPDTSEIPCEVIPNPEQAAQFSYLLRQLLNAIRMSRKDPEKAGRLWGALAVLPSFLDRAAVGPYDLKWPESCGGEIIASVAGVNPDTILPKEQWMLDRVAAEVQEGRNVMVLSWHTDLLPRLVRLLSEAGYKVATLDPARVPTAKRQAWIEREVVSRGVQVLVCNPVPVQTGLNNLVHFATQIWMENPGCHPTIYRQTCGRCDRIGQKKPTRFYFPVYQGTPQEKLRSLLFHKVGVSRGVDGLDPEEALRAAGVLDNEFSGFSVGRELYRMLTGD